MGITNSVVGAILRSPLHRVMSGSTALIRYTGRRSGQTRVTPVQYARDRDDIVILVGRPSTKSWWRNFEAERDIDVLLARRWVPMSGRAIVGADRPEAVERLLDMYLARFPRAARSFGESSPVSHAVMVNCRPK